MLTISIDASALKIALDKLVDDARKGNESGLDKVAQLALAAKQTEIAKTYSRTVPRGKSGKAKWERSGNWKDGQFIESKNGERSIVSAADYETRLADLPTGKDGVNRSNPAAKNARDSIEKRAIELMESEIKKALKL